MIFEAWNQCSYFASRNYCLSKNFKGCAIFAWTQCTWQTSKRRSNEGLRGDHSVTPAISEVLGSSEENFDLMDVSAFPPLPKSKQRQADQMSSNKSTKINFSQHLSSSVENFEDMDIGH